MRLTNFKYSVEVEAFKLKFMSSVISDFHGDVQPSDNDIFTIPDCCEKSLKIVAEYIKTPEIFANTLKLFTYCSDYDHDTLYDAVILSDYLDIEKLTEKLSLYVAKIYVEHRTIEQNRVILREPCDFTLEEEARYRKDYGLPPMDGGKRYTTHEEIEKDRESLSLKLERESRVTVKNYINLFNDKWEFCDERA